MQGPSAADAAMARQFFDGPSSSQAMGHVAPFQMPVGPRMAPGIHRALTSSGHQSHDSLSEAWGRTGVSDPLKEAWSRGGSASASQAHTPAPTIEQQRALNQSAMASMAFPGSMQG